MAGMSVITQVSREDGKQNVDPIISIEKVEMREPFRSRKWTRNFFGRLFCCFRSPVGQRSPTSDSSNNRESSSLNANSSVVAIKDKKNSNYLLGPISSSCVGKKCAVIDLDETLVHSSFQPMPNSDFVIPVEIDETIHQVYVLKRPHVEEFLKRMGELFECVLFTASLGKYADPVTNLLDKHNAFKYRLFRESCVFHHGSYVKDLSLIGRDLSQVFIIDNSPMSYLFHPKNAVPVISWFDDSADRELLDLLPFMEQLAASTDLVSLIANTKLPIGSTSDPNYHPSLSQSMSNIGSPTTPQLANGLQPQFATQTIQQEVDDGQRNSVFCADDEEKS